MNPTKPDDELRYQNFLREFARMAMPACDIGMRLLLQFRDEDPAGYAIAGEYLWNYPDDPRLEPHPGWQAFAKHYNDCDACNACSGF